MPRNLANRRPVEELPALLGGTPVRTQWLPYGRQFITPEDIQAVVTTLQSNLITQGPRVEEFEKLLSQYCGAAYGIAFSSGTAALHAACLAAGLGPGDEAITTPLTFAATANAIVYCGAKPVFADIHPNHLNIDQKKIQKLITPKTKVLLPVDFAGHPADLDSLLQLASQHNLTIIEDACHALGAQYKKRKIGSINSMTVFSFHPVKHITTGEGGMVLTNSLSLAEKLKTLRHHGIKISNPEKPWRYEIETLGYNYRLSDIHSALGVQQLQRIEPQLKRRREIAKAYQEAFSSLKTLTLPSINPEVSHAWHLYIILLELKKLSVDRDEILKALRAENIGVTWHYPPVHLQPFYQKQYGFKKGTCPIAESLTEQMITLPLFPTMTDQDIQDVVAAVKKVLTYYAN